MAFSVYNYVGAQGVNVSDTTQRVPLGTIVKGVDPTLGEGEFIYLLDVTGQFVGCVVIYNATTLELGFVALHRLRPVRLDLSNDLCPLFI